MPQIIQVGAILENERDSGNWTVVKTLDVFDLDGPIRGAEGIGRPALARISGRGMRFRVGGKQRAGALVCR